MQHMGLGQSDVVEKYVSKCADVCWLFRCHDPPVYMMFEEVKEGDHMDTKLYRSYIKVVRHIEMPKAAPKNPFVIFKN